jgi:hypothetical protein
MNKRFSWWPSLVDRCHHFVGTTCLYLQGRRISYVEKNSIKMEERNETG